MSKIYCSNCGTLVSSNANFCSSCGAPLHGAAASSYRINAPTVPAGETLAPNPPISDIEYIPRQHLGSGALMGFFLSFVAKSVMLLFLFAIGAALLPQVFIFVMIGYFVVTFLAALLMYNNFFYQIDEDGLTIESGIIHKYQVTVPYDQIQNVNIERTLLDRVLGVSRVSIETAGANAAVPGTTSMGNRMRAEAYLPGIDMKQAAKIHDLLIDLSEVAQN